MMRQLCFFLVVSLFDPFAHAAGLCLPNAVPPEDRKLIRDGNSTPTALNIWSFSWPSSQILVQLFKIVAEESIGLKVEVLGPGSSSSSGLYAIAGCKQPDDYHVDAGCDERPDPVPKHVAFEIWETAIVDRLEALRRDFPARAPLRMGDVGYTGMETMFVRSSIREAAYTGRGLPMEFYLSYDLAWHEPFRYFDDFRSVPGHRMKPCNETLLMEESDIKNYIKLTQDTEGAVVGLEGETQAKCWNDFWWLAPVCRDAPEKCVPVLTGGNGWFLYLFMQVAAKYRMPLAIGTVATWGDYLELPYLKNHLMYWWTPDISFVDLGPTEIIFPEFDPDKWNEGDKTSVARSTQLSNWGHPEIRRLSPKAYYLARSITISENTINGLLMDLRNSTSGDIAEVACTWLLASPSAWESWVPLATSCVQGQGMVDEAGRHVQSRSVATSCAWCELGTISTAVQDAKGMTFICSPCPAGTSQLRYGDQTCTSCAPGTYGNSSGLSQCQRCPAGTYQPEPGAKSCSPCPEATTTSGPGSASLSECVCPEGFFRPLDATQACERCPPGLRCDLGSDANHTPCLGGLAQEDSGEPWPRPLPQHYVSCAAPTEAYKCLHARACPGGEIEHCGNDFTGIVCAACGPGLYRSGGGSQCLPCTASSEVSAYFLPVLFMMLGPVMVLLLHKLAVQGRGLKSRATDVVASALFLLLVFSQVCATLVGCAVTLPNRILGWAHAMTYSIDFVDVVQLECVGGLSFGALFAIKLTVPIHALLVFLFSYGFAYLVRFLPGSSHVNWNIAINNYSNFMVTFFISILQHTLSVFQCYEHPNGRASLISAPQIFCGSGEWSRMAVGGVLATLFFGLGAFGTISYGVWAAPKRVQDPVFRTRWRFLLVRFRPQVWWWALVVLVRAVWLSLTQVLFWQGTQQLYWVLSMLLIYLVALLVFLPWQRLSLSFVDVTMHVAMVQLCALLFQFTGANNDEYDNSVVSGLMLLSLMMPCVCAGLVILGEFCSSCCTSPRLQDMAAQAQALRLFWNQIRDNDTLAQALSNLHTADLLMLAQAENVLQREMVKVNPDFECAPVGDFASLYACTPMSTVNTKRVAVVPEQIGSAATDPSETTSGGCSITSPGSDALHAVLPGACEA